MKARSLAYISILLAGLVLTSSPVRVHATTLMVPAEFATIQAAIDAAVTGDTIQVSARTYSEILTIKTTGISLVGESRNSTIIDGQFTGTVVWINASRVTVTGFTLRNPDDGGSGVHVENADNVTINGNLVSASVDGAGLDLHNANGTLVDGNVFVSNLYAVNIVSSRLNRVTNNRAVDNDTIGVNLDGSSDNLVSQNTFAAGEDAVDVGDASYDNTVSRNLVKDMSIFGVSMGTGSGSTPEARFPQNNTLVENTFQRNRVGIRLENETQNTFYHNDFFESRLLHVQPVSSTPGTTVVVSPNVWDNRTLGGFVGGNFWDNYTGLDGNHDGIGDSAYVIGTGNVDSRPLMAPFVPEPVLIQSIMASPASGSAPLTVRMSATVAGSLQFSYSWGFGDGSAGSTLASPVHAFVREGNFTVTLSVRDVSGDGDSLSVVVRVGKAAAPNYFLWILGGAGVTGLVAGLFVARRRRKLKKENAALQSLVKGPK